MLCQTQKQSAFKTFKNLRQMNTNKTQTVQSINNVIDKLIMAIDHNNIFQVKNILKNRNIDINAVGKYGETALARACRCVRFPYVCGTNKIQIILELLNYPNIDVNCYCVPYNKYYNGSNHTYDTHVVYVIIDNILVYGDTGMIRVFNEIVDNPSFDSEVKSFDSQKWSKDLIEYIYLHPIKAIIMKDSEKERTFTNMINKLLSNSVRAPNIVDKCITYEKLYGFDEVITFRMKKNNDFVYNDYVLDYLVRTNSVDVVSGDINGFTPLMYAVKNRNLGLVRTFLKNPKLIIDQTPIMIMAGSMCPDGFTALSYAVMRNKMPYVHDAVQCEIIKELLKVSDIDVNVGCYSYTEDFKNIHRSSITSIIYVVIDNIIVHHDHAMIEIFNMIVENATFSPSIESFGGKRKFSKSLIEYLCTHKSEMNIGDNSCVIWNLVKRIMINRNLQRHINHSICITDEILRKPNIMQYVKCLMGIKMMYRPMIQIFDDIHILMIYCNAYWKYHKNHMITRSSYLNNNHEVIANNEDANEEEEDEEEEEDDNDDDNDDDNEDDNGEEMEEVNIDFNFNFDSDNDDSDNDSDNDSNDNMFIDQHHNAFSHELRSWFYICDQHITNAMINVGMCMNDDILPTLESYMSILSHCFNHANMDINYKNMYGISFLYIASKFNAPEIVELLLRNPRINIEN